MTVHKKSSESRLACLELLERRSLFSASYTCVDLTRLVSYGATDTFEPVGITNSGLIAFNDVRAGQTPTDAGYVYSLSGHRLYPAPTGSEIEAITDNGGDAYNMADGSTVINFDGQLHTIPAPTDVGQYEHDSFGVTSMNNSGEVVGTYLYFNDTPGDGTTAFQTEVYDADATSVASPNNLTGYFDEGSPPKLNDAAQITGYDLIPGETQIGALVYNVNTQATINITAMFKSGTTTSAVDINQNGIVVGNYSRGSSVGGIFEYDTSTNTMTLIPKAAGEIFTANAISDSGEVVGQVQLTVRVRNHVRTEQHAAVFNTSGIVTDLDLQSAPLRGATLTSATGVNTDGDILTEGTDTSGAQHVYLLEPNS